MRFVWFWNWERRLIRAALAIASDSKTLTTSLREAALNISEAKRSSASLIGLGRKMESAGFGAFLASKDETISHSLEFKLDADWRSNVPTAFIKNSRMEAQ